MSETKKYLGIDWGEARIGLAVGDNTVKLATPRGVVKDLEGVVRVVIEDEIDELVVGEPRSLQGSTKHFSPAFQEFKSQLETIVSKPINYLDERFTTRAALALEGSKKEKAPQDAVAAMLILQAFLDKL